MCDCSNTSDISLFFFTPQTTTLIRWNAASKQSRGELNKGEVTFRTFSWFDLHLIQWRIETIDFFCNSFIFCQILAESCQHWHAMGRNNWLWMLAWFSQVLEENDKFKKRTLGIMSQPIRCLPHFNPYSLNLQRCETGDSIVFFRNCQIYARSDRSGIFVFQFKYYFLVHFLICQFFWYLLLIRSFSCISYKIFHCL